MKNYTVLITADAMIDVNADTEAEAIEEAKIVFHSNPYSVDSMSCTVMSVSDRIE